MSGGSGGGGKSGRGGGAAEDVQQPGEVFRIANEINAGLLKGVQPGSRNETKIKEMAATGTLTQNRETGLWRAGPYTGKNAKSVASKVDYKPIGERINALQSDIANAKSKFPKYNFDKATAKLSELKAERKRLYG